MPVTRTPKKAEFLLKRLETSIPGFDPDIERKLFEIGELVKGEAKMIATTKDIVDTGRLRSSIDYEIKRGQNEITVSWGTFGIPYGAYHEFGFRGVRPDMKRAMFASMTERGIIGTRAPKGLLVGSVFRARPFLRPALAKHRFRIRRILLGKE